MADDPKKVKAPIKAPEAEAEKPDIDPLELKLVKGIVDKFLVALKTYHLFPPNNINVKNTMGLLVTGFDNYFEEHDRPYALDTSNTELLYQKAPVYTEEDRNKSIAYTMNKDGVKRVIVHEGVDDKQLMDLMDVFQEVEVVDELEDDFVTLLWEKDCTHIQTIVYDSLLDPNLIPSIPSAKDMKRKNYVDIPATADKSAGQTQMAAFIQEQKQVLKSINTEIFNLTDEEKEQINERTEAEGNSIPLLDLMDILFNIFQTDHTWETFQDMVRMVKTTLENIIARKKFTLARVLGEKFSEMTDRKDILAPRHINEVTSTFESLGEGETIVHIVTYLKDPQQHINDDAYEFFKLLRRNALSPLLDVFLLDRCCEGLIPVLIKLGGRAAFPTFVKGLESKYTTVIGHTIDLLMQLDEKEALPHLVEKLTHPQPELRMKCLQILVERGGEQALPHILTLITDPEKNIRNEALNAITKRPFPEAFDALWDLFQKRSKLNLDVHEQELVLSAAARAAPHKAIPLFEKILSRKALLWFMRPKLEDLQRRVVFALARLTGDQVTSTLTRFAEGTEGFVQRICKTAIASMQHREEKQEEATDGQA